MTGLGFANATKAVHRKLLVPEGFKPTAGGALHRLARRAHGSASAAGRLLHPSSLSPLVPRLLDTVTFRVLIPVAIFPLDNLDQGSSQNLLWDSDFGHVTPRDPRKWPNALGTFYITPDITSPEAIAVIQRAGIVSR